MEKDTKLKRRIGPLDKGSFQYIIRKKREYILKVLLCACIGLAIYVLGLCLNRFQSDNIFTLIAILMVLPGAKALVALAVFWPFRSVSEDRGQKILKVLAKNYPDLPPESSFRQLPHIIEGKLSVYLDMVFTSSEKVMNLDVLVITSTRMLGLVGKQKQNLTYLNSHLQDSLVKRGLAFGVKVYEKEEDFIKALKELRPDSLEMEEKNKQDRKAVIEFIEVLIVR